MKRFVFLIVLLFTIQSVNAQFSAGLRGGLHFSSLPAQNYSWGDATIESLPDSYTGFHLGLMSQVRFYNIFIQPEVLFVSTGNEFRYESPDIEKDIFFTQRFTKVDVPLLIGLKAGPFRLGVGPVASLMLGSSNNLTQSEYYTGEKNLNERFNEAAYGFQAGFGLDIGNISLDLKYEAGLSNFSEEIQIGENTFSFDTRPRQIIFSIGLRFW